MSEFGTLNLEEMQGEMAAFASNGEGGEGGGSKSAAIDKFVIIPDPKPGQKLAFPVRILPPTKGGKLYQYTRLHIINGRKYQCPRPKLPNGKFDWKVACPVCDYVNTLYRKIDQLVKEGADKKNDPRCKALAAEAGDVKPIERYYYNVVCRKLTTDKGVIVNAGPKILSVGKVLHQKILAHIFGDVGVRKLGNVSDVKNGYDFVIVKTKKGDEFANYDASYFEQESTAAGTAEEIKAWVEAMHDLTENRKPTEYDVLEKQLAIHRRIIPDEKTDGFNVDDFDAKMKAKYGNGGSTSVTVATGGSVPAAAKPQNEDEALASVVGGGETPSTTDEDMSIGDEEFKAMMEGMKAE